MAFDASRDERFSPLLRRVFLEFGVAGFWTALIWEGRAFEVWRDLRAQSASTRHLSFGAIRAGCVDRLKELLDRRARGQCPSVPAWSLPNSRKMRGLGLGRMWTVLCPFCHEFHTHSPGESCRTPHCCSDRDRNQYVLEFAGALPLEHHTRFYRSSKAGLPRLLHQWPETSCHHPGTIMLLAA